MKLTKKTSIALIAWISLLIISCGGTRSDMDDSRMQFVVEKMNAKIAQEREKTKDAFFSITLESNKLIFLAQFNKDIISDWEIKMAESMKKYSTRVCFEWMVTTNKGEKENIMTPAFFSKLKDKNVDIIYVIKDKNGKILTEVTMDPVNLQELEELYAYEWNANAIEPSSVVKGSVVDDRDGKTYKTVKIGKQTWMAENLNFKVDNSSCYSNQEPMCDKYGRLYTWDAAMDSAAVFSTSGKDCGNENKCSATYPVRGICPKGWHLPTFDEFDSLKVAVGGRSKVGINLKAASGWENDWNGADTYGFSALPAGNRSFGLGSFWSEGSKAFFWSSTERSEKDAFQMTLTSDDQGVAANEIKSASLSVRCVKD